MGERVHEKSRPFLLIAEDIEGEVRNILVLNKMHGEIKVCAVKAPGFGDRRKAMLEDIAILTGGKAVMEDSGVKLNSLRLSDLGQADRIVITKDSTTIIKGKGDTREIRARVKQIRQQINDTSS